MLDWDKVSNSLEMIYLAVQTLEEQFEGRKFTPDGHLVGSIGEVLAAYAFDLVLEPASTKGFDAIATDGRKVEIKMTQAKSVAFRHQPEHAIVLLRRANETTQTLYNGPGDLVWENCGRQGSNGQRAISVAKLMKLNGVVHEQSKLSQFRDYPV
ncbi:hypothetical protein [uncultured Maritalea sp.]|jgi:hypothetical protein|uniref:DUF6998 domain-containing protein n=1 Tax=uncultured Maritalea sp. TaxID=757249 RepID=UPI00262FE5CF|nr:hypothetical protein [uncultured Maritalea sp.]